MEPRGRCGEDNPAEEHSFFYVGGLSIAQGSCALLLRLRSATLVTNSRRPQLTVTERNHAAGPLSTVHCT